MVTSSQRRSPRKPHPSPKKSASQGAAKKQRGPRYCQRCGGKYLQKDCPVHSAQARKNRRGNLSAKPDTATPASPCDTEQFGTSHQTTSDATSANKTHVAPSQEPMQASQHASSIPPPSVIDISLRDAMVDSRPPVIQPSLLPPMPSVPSAVPRRPLPDTASLKVAPAIDPALQDSNTAPVIDPTLLALPDPTNRFQHQVADLTPPINSTTSFPRPLTQMQNKEPCTPPPQRHLLTMNGDSISASLDSPSPFRSPPSIQHPRIGSRQDGQRVRVSRSNAVYGLVHGAFKGSEEWKIPRVRAHKQTMVKGSVQKRFDEKLGAIFNRCEELGDETGAYLFISAQLPSARHGIAHYVSKRLRDEPLDGLDQLFDLTDDVYSSVVAARRRDVAQAEYRAAKALREVAEAKSAEATARADLEGLTQKYELQEQVLEGVRRALREAGQENLLGILPGPTSNVAPAIPTANEP